MLFFTRLDDARRVMAVLPKRFAKYGLTLHPEKTKLVELVRPDLREERVEGHRPNRPATFDFLGFTHFWGRTRRGKWNLVRKTAKDRFSRALKSIHRWCRQHRHLDLTSQQRILTWKLRGHFAYFTIRGNSKAIGRFRYEVVRAWHEWLRRRSQRASIPWSRMSRLMERYPLPPARLVHPARAANP